ncbi:hypothetical protein [Opitutus sp. ER46]|uniref:hypothetical protein n=1 Tax=Opitutus sp. ER46 TaxID=2161864 RepID=UPI000D31F92F|nr:hypothetical protein [Opitutus sp. ER46]PTX91522.1 hypothetical protein DB354_16690 [Opitutus sp. ER46]
MHAPRLTLRPGVLTAAALSVLVAPLWGQAPGAERERNNWPIIVQQTDDSGQARQWTSVGPLLYGQTAPDGSGSAGGLRPVWIEQSDTAGHLRSASFLYPLFSYRADESTYQWNVFELIRRSGGRAGAATPAATAKGDGLFEVWPFWFSRQTGDPEMSYRALFPVAGTVKNKLGMEKASWVIFPAYAAVEKRGATTTYTPWPIVRVTRGAAHGFGIWPLFEIREQPGRFRTETYLWPLGYNNTRQPAEDAPAGTPPVREVGVLPFYARHSGPGVIDETYLWPFFGYTDRRSPVPYRETRYLWPFLVQGRGDNRYVNRWGPVYTHSVVKGYDKTWYAWPVLRHARWTTDGLSRERTQLLFFLYWSEQQRSATNPGLPAATLTHLWPLVSTWDNGAGRKQVQFFSPFEVFFPNNEKVRAAWSPLFAVARFEQKQPGTTRTSLLWNAITWRRDDARQAREFHLGPLFSSSRLGAARRIALGNGVVALERAPGSGWKLRWFNFPSSAVNAAAQPSR